MKAASRFPLKSCHVAKDIRQVVNMIMNIARDFFMPVV